MAATGARKTLTHGRNRLPSSFDSSFKWPLCLARRTPAAVRTPLRNHKGKRPANARRPATALPNRGPWLPGGTHQETCKKVYRDRILRGQEAYSTFKLGAIDSDLRTVACVFKIPWSCVLRSLADFWQAWLLSEAAFRRGVLGRLTEVIEPMVAGLEMSIRQESGRMPRLASRT